MNQNSRKTLGRISLYELSISKFLDFQLAILLKVDSLTDFFSRICRLSRKTLRRNTFERLLLALLICYSNTKPTVKKILNCFVDISLLLSHVLDPLQNTTKTSTLNDTYSLKSQNCTCQILW